jgi:hypothetical protein
MERTDPIDAYLDELRRELRVSRRARRRILTEVREHLLDAAEAERARTADGSGAVERGSGAVERAVLRFGPAAATALQFNGAADRRKPLLRRALVPSLAAFLVTSMASASVWAFAPGHAPARSRTAHAHLIQREPAARRAPNAQRAPARVEGPRRHGLHDAL